MDTSQILTTLRHDGFAEVPLPRHIAERSLRLVKQFYEKPLSERISIAAFHGRGVLGYYPSEHEAREIEEKHAHVVPVFEPVRARGYCSYDYLSNGRILAASQLFGANLWPPDEGFRVEACTLYELVSQFAKEIARSILSQLEQTGNLFCLPGNVFDQDCCSIMRLLKYAKQNEVKESKAHTDYEFISVVHADTQGLEVQNASGIWNVTPCSIGKVVILPGDMLEVASNGWVQSALHRVRFGLEDRLSAIFFQGLGLDQEITYSINGEQVVSTFGKHLCGMLVRGSPHLRAEIHSWEKTFGTTIPEKNPFRRNKETYRNQ